MKQCKNLFIQNMEKLALFYFVYLCPYGVQILEEMRIEREEELLTQADSLAIQMAKLQYQKAERKTKVLETSRAMLTLQSLLIEELRARRSLGGVEMLQNIQSHYLVSRDAPFRLFLPRYRCLGFVYLSIPDTNPVPLLN